LLLFLFLGSLVGVDSSVEFSLFCGGLESTVTHLTGGIDEFKVDLFLGESGGLGEEGLSEDEDFFLGPMQHPLIMTKSLLTTP